MLLRWTAVLAVLALAAVIGVASCSPQRDATSSLMLQSPSSAPGAVPGDIPSASIADARRAAQPKEEGERKSL